MKKHSPLEKVICAMYMKFLMQRAESLQILRRVALDNFDISFLITDQHCLIMNRHKLVDFICQFIEDVDAEMNQMKLSLNSRGRAVASCFIKGLSE